jgi:predicted lipopolysaccharide heptosyltransferase III
MNSLRDIVESSPQLRELAMHGVRNQGTPEPLGPALWNWREVKRVLVIRLRSIGDTVLTTPSLFALKRFLPQSQVDVLLEDWVAPLMDGFEYVDNVITLTPKNIIARLRVAQKLRTGRYDVVYNLHGGTTATLLTAATGAKHRVGYKSYQYSRLHQHLAPAPSVLWGREKTHSVEQQLGLLGWTGVPVTDRPASCLTITPEAKAAIDQRLQKQGIGTDDRFALIHPTAAFDTKQWAVDKFAKVAETLFDCGMSIVGITAEKESKVARALQEKSSRPVTTFTNLTLPELSALIARASLFVGNDSGVAHIAAAVGVPTVVIFGSSNVDHWRPWSRVPSEVVREELDCQPCHGYFCEKFSQPECIQRVPEQKVLSAIERVLRESGQ